MTQPPLIVGIGEALFDVYPEGSRLGGAPLNFTVHAHQLGNTGVVVSRVGTDTLGDAIAAELERRGMTTRYLQRDRQRPTGTVQVNPDEHGEPHYDIVRDVAWDALEHTAELDALAPRAAAVCFGSLAQRDPRAGEAIRRFLAAAPQALRLFDINIRQHYYGRDVITRSLQAADAVKINSAELDVLRELLSLPRGIDEAVGQLLDRFGLRWAAVTRGAEGAVVFTATQRFDAQPVRVTGRIDAVGAGDSASAALVHGYVRRWPWDRTLTLANHLGAYVASQPGACPPLTDALCALAR